MLNFLHAVPLTPLHDRMRKEGRLIEHSVNSSDSTVSNFRTLIPSSVLVRGFQRTLSSIYNPEKFYERAWRSLNNWQAKNCQHPSDQPDLMSMARIALRSFWRQGLRSDYRSAYWKYFFRLFFKYAMNRPKLWLGFTILISGQHFIPYSREVVQKVEGEITETVPIPQRMEQGVPA